MMEKKITMTSSTVIRFFWLENSLDLKRSLSYMTPPRHTSTAQPSRTCGQARQGTGVIVLRAQVLAYARRSRDCLSQSMVAGGTRKRLRRVHTGLLTISTVL
jgi:hypothetical protein